MRRAWNNSAIKSDSSNTRRVHNTSMKKITTPREKSGNTMWEE